jgi:glycosyltransferase involved in cell wall biosynthesis
MEKPRRRKSLADKLRVAHIITQLELGGAQQNTLYTVSHLRPDRFEPTLLCGQGGLLDEEAKKGSWRTYFIPSLVRPVRPWWDLVALGALYRHLRQTKPHIVHTHSSKAGILGRVAAYLAGVPVIIHTFHGFGFTPVQWSWVRKFFVALEWFCARLSSHLIFVSQENQKEAATLGIISGKRTSLIRSGIIFHAPPPPSRLREELGIPPEAWVVTSVGNFKQQKNPMHLVQVARAVHTKDASVHFLVVGDGELRPKVERYIQTHVLGDHVHLLGWRQDIPQILQESDAFLLTSLWEGLPRALVEAAFAGKPAVAYAVDGVKDILLDGHNGFLVPSGEVEMAARKLLWLKDHPGEAKRMGAEARKQVEREFDIDVMVRQQEALYEKLWEAVPLKSYYEASWNSQSPTPTPGP